MFLHLEKSVFRYVSASCLQNVYLALLRSILIEKMISLVIFDTSFIQMVKCSLLDKSVARCLLSIRKTLLKKLYLWFCLAQIVQMVKYSFLNKRVVYRSFYTHRQDLADVYCHKDLVEKIISPVIFDTNHSFKWKMLFL